MKDHKQINRVKVFIIYLLSWGIFGFLGVVAQESTATLRPPEEQHESLFPNDTCTPPCWLGLIPGESQTEDVVDFFTTFEQAYFVAAYENEELIHIQDGDIPVIEDGFYSFDLGPAEFSLCCGIYSRFQIRDGILYDVKVLILQIVTFSEAIEQLGMPDAIHMGRYDVYSASDYSSFFFDFIYFSSRLRVVFTSNEDLQHPLICNYEGLADNVRADLASYYSPQAANEVHEVSVGGNEDETIPLPALFAYNQQERHFPQKMWGMILGTEPSTSVTCEDLWDTLPEEIILPEAWYEEEAESE